MMNGHSSSLRVELVTALSLARASVPVSTLKRRVSVTRHESRIASELRRMERDGIARFTRDGGWELVQRSEAVGMES